MTPRHKNSCRDEFAKADKTIPVDITKPPSIVALLQSNLVTNMLANGPETQTILFNAFNVPLQSTFTRSWLPFSFENNCICVELDIS